MLELKNLSVSYGETPVVRELSFSLEQSEILMLLGPTGCGKTTILRAIAGLVPIADGEIRMGAILIDRSNFLPPEKRNVGMVFQDFALFPHLNVEKNIGFRLSDPSQVDHWLRALSLEPQRHAMPDTLSGGQKQRVALARALAHKPGLMLLDEPLSNLDAALKSSMRWTIRKALKEAGVPAIWVTHDQEEAMLIGDRVGILSQGRMEQIDKPEACFARPATRFVAEFLGEAFFLPVTVRGETAETALGSAQAIPVDGVCGRADLLLRPDDVSISSTGASNAKVVWSRFEGGSRLYAAELEEGHEVRVRVSHELNFDPGESVRVELVATHPLMAYKQAGKG